MGLDRKEIEMTIFKKSMPFYGLGLYFSRQEISLIHRYDTLFNDFCDLLALILPHFGRLGVSQMYLILCTARGKKKPPRFEERGGVITDFRLLRVYSTRQGNAPRSCNRQFRGQVPQAFRQAIQLLPCSGGIPQALCPLTPAASKRHSAHRHHNRSPKQPLRSRDQAPVRSSTPGTASCSRCLRPRARTSCSRRWSRTAAPELRPQCLFRDRPLLSH